MARIFSISFLHNGVERTALISVRPTPFATEYTITMAHEDLLEALPSQRILSTGSGSFVFVDPIAEEPTALMQAILLALSERVQASV